MSVEVKEKKGLKKYLRLNKFPHIWCPGCGNGIIMRGIVQAVDDLGLNQDNVVVISGIGCSSRAPGYLDFNTLHTAHGRALAFATGIKLAKPKLHILVITGDGDCSAIGGNHLIHAARRNIDITVIVFNNSIYGMTSGQYSPLTPYGSYATTAPYGNIEHNFDLCGLVEGAGGTYIARTTVYHAAQIPKLVAGGIKNKGFSFIEVIVNCHTYYGRKNKMKEAIKMLEWQKENAVPVSKKGDPGIDMTGKFYTGVLKQTVAPEYCEAYDKLISETQRR